MEVHNTNTRFRVFPVVEKGVEPVEELYTLVLQGFGLKAHRITKEKSYFICSTSQGALKLQKSFDTPEGILFQHSIKEHLQRKGFPVADRFLLSVDGLPYVLYDQSVYTLGHLPPGKEANFSDTRCFEGVVATLAHFHQKANHIAFPGSPILSDQRPLTDYAKDLADLVVMRKRISSQKRMSDFDVLFLKNYESYATQLQQALELLDKNAALNHYMKKAREENAVCHGIMKSESFLVDKGQMLLVNYSMASVGSRMLDLSSLIRRYAKRLQGYIITVEDIVRLYDRHASLEREELNILYPLLLYPQKFIRICNQYYAKKRTWTPNAIANRMENLLAGKDAYDAYIQGLQKL